MAVTTAPASIAFVAPTADQIRDNYLRAIKAGLIARGVLTPNVNAGSDDYIRGQAIGNEVEVVSYNTVLSADQLMPDTATGKNLVRIMAIYGLAPRPAEPSFGSIVFSTATAQGIVTGAQLLDPNGNIFVVTTGGVYNNGDLIPVESSGVGAATNLPAGTSLKWVSPPAYAQPTALLATGGASGGTDAESDDDARTRLLTLIQDAPGSGDDAQVAAFAEQGSGSVQKAFVYPAANGPGTEHVAVAGFASASASKSRAVTSTVLSAAASSTIGQLPTYTECVVTATADQQADVAFLLTMPAATSASPPGDGTGFIDANPFPSVTGATTQRMRVHAADLTPTSTQFSVESMRAPTPGQSICWVDRDTFTLHTAKITTVGTTYASPSGGTPGRYGVTIDTPFVSTVGSIPADGDYIFPSALSGANYLAAILDRFAALGPYEKQLAAGLQPRCLRQPRYFKSWPYSLTDLFLRALEDAGEEVLTAAWGYQNGGTTNPSLPTSITSAPFFFVPRQIAWYAP